MAKRIIIIIFSLTIIALLILNINPVLEFVGGILPNTCTFIGTIGKPKGKIIVKYYSPDWMPDGKRIAYIKSTEHKKYIYGWYFQINLNREDTQWIDYQVCSLDLETNKEKVIRSIKVYPKSDHYGHRFWYEWNDKKYKGIKAVRSLDVNPINGQILIATLNSEKYEATPGPTFILKENGKDFTRIIDDGLNNPRWSYDGEKIIYGIDKSFWVMDLRTKTNKMIVDKVDIIMYESVLSSDGKKIAYYDRDKMGCKLVIASLDDINKKDEFHNLSSCYISDWSRDGTKILLDTCVYIYDIDKLKTGNAERFCFKGITFGGRFSNDGKKIVSGGHNYSEQITVVNSDNAEIMTIKKNYEIEFK